MSDLYWSLLATIPALTAAGMVAFRLRHRRNSDGFAAFLASEEHQDA